MGKEQCEAHDCAKKLADVSKSPVLSVSFTISFCYQ